jgi:hypothetical protein
VAGFGMCSFGGVIVIGREHGILARADRTMDRIISATAAQASKGAVMFPAAVVLRMGAMERPVSTAHPREEQAGKGHANKYFGDRLHI